MKIIELMNIPYNIWSESQLMLWLKHVAKLGQFEELFDSIGVSGEGLDDFNLETLKELDVGTIKAKVLLRKIEQLK